MSASDKTINLILKDLTNVHENLLSLSDDIWNSIDHNDSDKLDEGYQFKKEFNRLLDIFEQNSSEISALVSQFTGIKTEQDSREVKKDNPENLRLIKELDKEVPHDISEDFTYKKPYAFVFEECAYTDLLTWADLYVQLVSCLAKKNKDLLLTLADNEEYISKQNKKYYTRNKNDVRVARQIFDGFYIETNLSAKFITRKIIELLNVFNISKDKLIIYLRQDRNA